MKLETGSFQSASRGPGENSTMYILSHYTESSLSLPIAPPYHSERVIG